MTVTMSDNPSTWVGATIEAVEVIVEPYHVNEELIDGVELTLVRDGERHTFLLKAGSEYADDDWLTILEDWLKVNEENA
jgi:hypothetical protein